MPKLPPTKPTRIDEAHLNSILGKPLPEIQPGERIRRIKILTALSKGAGMSVTDQLAFLANNGVAIARSMFSNVILPDDTIKFVNAGKIERKQSLKLIEAMADLFIKQPVYTAEEQAEMRQKFMQRYKAKLEEAKTAETAVDKDKGVSRASRLRKTSGVRRTNAGALAESVYSEGR